MGKDDSDDAADRGHRCTWINCGKVFVTPSKLKVHVRSHTGEKPYACHFDACDYRAPYSSHFKAHTKTHTWEKPHVCVWHGCDYRASDSSALKRHTKTHTERKPYVCVWHGCDYRTSQTSHLKTHTKTHTGTPELVALLVRSTHTHTHTHTHTLRANLDTPPNKIYRKRRADSLPIHPESTDRARESRIEKSTCAKRTRT